MHLRWQSGYRGLGFRDLGFRDLGFRNLRFRVSESRVSGFRDLGNLGCKIYRKTPHGGLAT